MWRLYLQEALQLRQYCRRLGGFGAPQPKVLILLARRLQLLRVTFVKATDLLIKLDGLI